jgi:hypothetical protein
MKHKTIILILSVIISRGFPFKIIFNIVYFGYSNFVISQTFKVNLRSLVFV